MTESRTEAANKVIDSFSDAMKEVVGWYDKSLMEYGAKYNEVISFVALAVLTYGKNNQISFTAEEAEKFKGSRFHLNSNTDDGGGITITVIYDDEEETDNAESDSGEDI